MQDDESIYCQLKVINHCLKKEIHLHIQNLCHFILQEATIFVMKYI